MAEKGTSESLAKLRAACLLAGGNVLPVCDGLTELEQQVEALEQKASDTADPEAWLAARPWLTMEIIKAGGEKTFCVVLAHYCIRHDRLSAIRAAREAAE